MSTYDERPEDERVHGDSTPSLGGGFWDGQDPDGADVGGIMIRCSHCAWSLPLVASDHGSDVWHDGQRRRPTGDEAHAVETGTCPRCRGGTPETRAARAERYAAGRRVRDARVARRLSLRTVAEACGVSCVVLGRMERGLLPVSPDVATLVGLDEQESAD